MSIPDTVEAVVICLWSNIGKCWTATLETDDGEIAVGHGQTRAEALRELAEVIE